MSVSTPLVAPSTPISCVILGCTGTVGQRFVSLLATHPWFRIAALAASPRTAGKEYQNACQWKLSSPMPEFAKQLKICLCKADEVKNVIRTSNASNASNSTAAASVPLIAFSALDSSVAGEIESEFASAGYRVFSNARNHRMDVDVPILIPHVNSSHLQILKAQQRNRQYENSGGFIVTNANCSSTGLVIALAPILRTYGIDHLSVVTMQAISGAGYPGVSSFDILDNIVPFISGEEEKMEIEPLKILGELSLDNSKFEFAPFKVSAQCNRVPVIDGHMECVSIKLTRHATPEQIAECMKNYTSEAQQLNLPSAPKRCIKVFNNTEAESNRPQPRLDRDTGDGMTVTVGRLRQCPLADVKFTLCSHNTVIGAAGGSIQNAELAYAKGLI